MPMLLPSHAQCFLGAARPNGRATLAMRSAHRLTDT
jgi:hypothetical protein